MNYDEKLEKVCKDFLMLSKEQQDYILGIMQALAYANSAGDNNESENQPESEKNAN